MVDKALNEQNRENYLAGMRYLTLTVMIGIIECRADTVSQASFESEVSCGRMGQELIDRGDYELAVSSLEQSLKNHPRSDWLYSLLGRAYFKMGDLELAEAQFRKALDINKNNPVAKRMVLEMRKTQDLLRDRDFYEWINIAKERAADLVTLVIGVWLGTLLSGISGRFYSHFVRTNFRKALAKKDFDYVTDILEDLQIKREKRSCVCACASFLKSMILKKPRK